MQLKEDANPECMLSTNHLGLTCQWFLHNPEYHLGDSYGVICSDIIQVTSNIYNTMISLTGSLNGVQMA